jgi:hypothetical protein
VFVIFLLGSAIGAVWVYRNYPTISASRSESLLTSSSFDSRSLATVRISNSLNLASIAIAENNSAYAFRLPTLDPNTGLIYFVASIQDGGRLLMSFNTTSFTYRFIETLPDVGLGISIDSRTNEIYVTGLGVCTRQEATSNYCRAFTGGADKVEIMKLNGTSGAIESSTLIPWTTEFDIGINSHTRTLFVLQSCPDRLVACGRLLAFDADTGALKGNLSLRATFVPDSAKHLVVDPVNDMVYVAASWQGETSRSGQAFTQGVIAVNALDYSVRFRSVQNYTNSIGLALDQRTNVVYGTAQNSNSTDSTTHLFAISGTSGSTIFSVVVGTSCSVGGGLAVNTASNQIYLYGREQGTDIGSLIAVDGTNGHVMGMLPSSPIQDVMADPARERIYVSHFYYASDLAISTIPNAVFQGNVNPSVLNATCPISHPQ